jgi:hypothetical protein
MTDSGEVSEPRSVQLRRLWAALRLSPTTAPGHMERRLEASLACEAFAAVSVPERQDMLILRLAVPAPPRQLQIRTRSAEMLVQADDAGETVVYLRLLDPTHQDVFSLLAADLVDRASESATPANALRMLIRRLHAWRRLLEDLTVDALGRDRQRGLYGELWFLEEHLLGRLPPEAAFAAWVGPLREEQDFHLGDSAVEVKTTGAQPPFVARVNGAAQLDDGGLQALFLVHLAVDERLNHGDTLNELVDRLRDIANGRAAEILDERLLLAGYRDPHRESYEVGYVVTSARCFRIAEGFPRIVPAQLCPGVGDVRYSVDIDVCLEFEVPVTTFAERLAAYG